jgi:hypothetical protein
VVFVAGDYHCAGVASIAIPSATSGHKLHAYAIVAPPLYAPYPFANTRSIEFGATDPIFDPEVRDRALAECRDIQVREMQGFALVRVERVPGQVSPANWRVVVDFYRDSWEGTAPPIRWRRVEALAAPLAIGTLEGGRATLR